MKKSMTMGLVVCALVFGGSDGAWAKSKRKMMKKKQTMEQVEDQADDQYSDESGDEVEYRQRRSSRSEDFSRWGLGAELLGAGVLYSAYGTYRFAREIGVNFGFSFYSASSAGVSATIIVLPLYASYLLGDRNHFFELDGGLDIVIASASVDAGAVSLSASGSGALPLVGLGYRYWPEDGGFLFRANLYGLIANGFNIWFGLTFGYAF